jgi:glycosyltransferase involved in cell wall biosynthesis
VQFPWGVDLERFCPPASVSPHLREGANDGRIVLSTRAWENSHGIDILLEAFRLAHAEEPTLRLVLLGTGSLRNEVLEFVEESGLSNAVQAVGQVPEEMLPAYFQSADVYVSCARTDGTSVSLLQALAVGVPIVATDNPSNREWIIPERNGLLAEMGASSAVAKAILELGRLSQADRKLMGERNREVAESRADWPRNVQKLIATYERIMSARGR